MRILQRLALNMDTPLVNTDTFYAPLPPPSVSVLTGFDCLDFQDWRGGEEGVWAHNSRALSLSNSFLRACQTFEEKAK